MVVVFNVVQHHGYDGLVMATLMAGTILIAAGLFRLGTWIKYIPEPDAQSFDQRQDLPDGVEAFQLRGPLFFGAATHLSAVLDGKRSAPKVFIVRMREVPLIDTTGVTALRDFVKRCKSEGTTVIVTGVPRQPRQILKQMGFSEQTGDLNFAANFKEALNFARTRI